MEGYDRSKIEDALYFDDRQKQAYVPLDEAAYARLLGGMIRL
jgi:hypothetical protein